MGLLFHSILFLKEAMEFKTMMKKEFKVYSPLTAKSVDSFITKSSDESYDGERILLEGIASTTSRDLHDEIVSSAAIESMSEQALSLNIHGDHWYGLDDVIGAIKDASVEDKQLHVKFLITKKHTPDIQDLLETGVKLGLSIGGYVTSYDEKNRIINAIELHEISLTAMPANWDTFGTVTTSKGLVKSNCIAGACHAIVKKLGEETMAKKEIKTKEETSQEEEETSGLTQDDVIELFNELMAEKEETIVQEITDKVQTQLESIAEAKVQELLDDDSSSEEEAEEETKADSEEDPEKEEEDKEEEEETKSLTPEDIAAMVKDGIAQAIGEDFASKVAGEMWGDLNKSRSTDGSKFKQFQDQIGETEPTEPVEKTGYSSEEAAKILLAKQKRANPLTAAVMKQLE